MVGIIDDKSFDKRNALNAEMSQLLSNLAANTSSIGDWKVIKIYEARMQGEEDPYDFEELAAERQATRDRINEIKIELKKLDDEVVENNEEPIEDEIDEENDGSESLYDEEATTEEENSEETEVESSDNEEVDE